MNPLEQTEALFEAERATGIPYVLVNRVIHPATVFRIGRRRVLFDTELKGPIRIEKRKIENVTEFVAVNQLSGSINVVPSAAVDDLEAPT